LQFQKPVMVQEQKLKMNPQLYQSIQLMALPLQDLKFRIQEEVEKNPALEMMEDNTQVSIEEETPKKQTEDYDYFENSSDPGYTRSGTGSEGEDTKRKFIEGTLSRPISLQDHLLWQLKLQPISKEWFKVGELLIMNLDQNGFHIVEPETLVKGKDKTLIPHVMALIQGFDPIGTCTKNYKESLLVQISLKPEAPPLARVLLEEYFDLLERGKHAEIAKKLKVKQEKVEEILGFIKTLNPFPGREYSIENPTYVIPDLMVKLRDGEFVIILNDEEIPVLGINPFFTQISNELPHEKKKDVKTFVNASVKNARWFIHAIHQRNQTLLKVAKAIVEFQRDFFLKGPKKLVPLTLKDIAKEIGVHEATVSRITTSKYMQTEWGIFELKYFFSNSISGAGSSGSRFSKEGVKEIIKEIIEEEKTRHLSDQNITEILQKRGISLARRTVAKYRKELDILSSYNRKK